MPRGKTRTQLVLEQLIQARLESSTPFPLTQTLHAEDQWISGGWRPNWFFCQKHTGGVSGVRHIRFLRNDHGVPIDGPHTHQYRTQNPHTGEWEAHNAILYRLGITPDVVRDYDWSKALGEDFMHWQYEQSIFVTEDNNGQYTFAG